MAAGDFYDAKPRDYLKMMFDDPDVGKHARAREFDYGTPVLSET